MPPMSTFLGRLQFESSPGLDPATFVRLARLVQDLHGE